LIYSPDHNFLMIKNTKVGGTSLEVELSKVLPDNSIVTQIKPENINHVPRNYDGFYNHMPYSEIKNKIDLANTRSYVFVRNPYDIVLSNFFHQLFLSHIDYSKINLKQKNTLLDKYFFGNDQDITLIKSTKRLYTSDNNEIQVNKILRYEKGIEYEINPVLFEHGIRSIFIKTFEKSYRPKEIKYQDIFSKDHIDLIQQEWSWEFENLGYGY
jgi:hypothetical protein